MTQTMTMVTTTRDASSVDNGALLMDTNFEVVNIQEFDIQLTDLKGEAIREMLIDGTKHLSWADSSSSSNTTLNGITFGDYSRILVTGVLSANGKSVNAIIMLVATCSPYTFLTEETLKALNMDIVNQPGNQACVLINGERVKVHLLKAHFKEVNVLGTNFLDFCEVNIDYPRKKARIKIVPV